MVNAFKQNRRIVHIIGLIKCHKKMVGNSSKWAVNVARTGYAKTWQRGKTPVKWRDKRDAEYGETWKETRSLLIDNAEREM